MHAMDSARQRVVALAHGRQPGTLAASLRGSAGLPARCTLHEVRWWTGQAPVALDDALTFATRRVLADKTLVHQHQRLESFYVVGAGSFKLVRIEPDGGEQVLGFAWRGDVIGLDAVVEQRQCGNVIALEDSMVALLPYEQCLQPDARPVLADLLQRAAAVELQHRSQTQYLMAAANAEVRAARFLLAMGQRQRGLGYSGTRFRLTMSRRDVASYLGVAHETVSRAFTLLAQAGYLTVSHREIELVDLDGLTALARQSRGASPGAEIRHRLRQTDLTPACAA